MGGGCGGKVVVLSWGLNGGRAEEARGRHARLETSGLYVVFTQR